MRKCKRCGAEIKWIRTTAGKQMPCDTETVPYRYQLGARDRVVTPNGEVLPCVVYSRDDMAHQDAALGYIPHFVTCKGGRGR